MNIVSGLKQLLLSKIDSLGTTKSVLFAAIMILGFFAVGVSAGQLPAIQSFDSTCSPIILGSCSELNWSTMDAKSVYIDQGIGVVQPNGSMKVCPKATTNYTMVAINGNNSTSAPVEVEVIYIVPTIYSFDAEPGEVKMGGMANLSWNVSGATLGVTIDPDGSTIPMVGNKTVFPFGRAQYTLNATNESGSRVMTLVMDCINPSVNLTGNPSRILYGDQATLEWSSTEANRMSFDQGLGDVAANGQKTVPTEKRTTYTLKAFNPCDEIATNSTTIDVYHSIYNFVKSGEYASWKSAKGIVKFGTPRDDERGSVALVNDRLVGDTTEGLRLWTHPNWNANGYIEGVYDLSDFMIPGRRYTPEQWDHLSGEYGLFKDAKSIIWCGEVTFSIILRSQGVPDFTLVGPTLLNCDHTRNAFNAYIPAQFYGKPISIVLRADAGADSTLDHAGWKDVVLLRG